MGCSGSRPPVDDKDVELHVQPPAAAAADDSGRDSPHSVIVNPVLQLLQEESERKATRRAAKRASQEAAKAAATEALPTTPPTAPEAHAAAQHRAALEAAARGGSARAQAKLAELGVVFTPDLPSASEWAELKITVVDGAPVLKVSVVNK